MLNYFQEPLDRKWERSRGFSKIVLEIDMIKESCFWSFGIFNLSFSKILLYWKSLFYPLNRHFYEEFLTKFCLKIIR